LFSFAPAIFAASTLQTVSHGGLDSLPSSWESRPMISGHFTTPWGMISEATLHTTLFSFPNEVRERGN
jgi:hypothetical protein